MFSYVFNPPDTSGYHAAVLEKNWAQGFLDRATSGVYILLKRDILLCPGALTRPTFNRPRNSIAYRVYHQPFFPARRWVLGSMLGSAFLSHHPKPEALLRWIMMEYAALPVTKG